MDALALEPNEGAFLEALQRLGVRYLIIGMSAALLQGARGVTEDVDLWFERLDEPAIGEAARSANGFWISGSFGMRPPGLGGLGRESALIRHLATFLQGAGQPRTHPSQTGAPPNQGLGCPPSVQGIVYKFESFAALSQALATEESDVKLPTPTSDHLVDGQWLVATFTIGNDATSVAGRVADRGTELHLTFEERDWNQLCRFANGECPPSIPPPCLEGAEVVSAPPGTTVLVVDDDPALRSIVCTMLHTSHIKTLQVESAEEALDWLGKNRADLLVLDWGLPGMNGVELCARLRQEDAHRTLPILFLTGHSSSTDLVEAFEAGADDFVSKPFRAPELRARVLGLLRRVSREQLAARA